jgi:sec-independent protein translocase protein TatA
MNAMQLAMLNGWEIVLILAIVLVLFGAKKLPELAKGLGHGIKEFKKATRDVTDELQSAIDEPPPPPTRRITEKTDTETASASATTVPHTTSPESKA